MRCASIGRAVTNVAIRPHFNAGTSASGDRGFGGIGNLHKKSKTPATTRAKSSGAEATFTKNGTLLLSRR